MSSVTAFWKVDIGITWMRALGRDCLEFCHSCW